MIKKAKNMKKKQSVLNKLRKLKLWNMINVFGEI